MNEIIEISDIRKAIPKKKIWYKYFDDIFISVVPEENIIPHIRRKAIIQDNKKDNKMSPWHLHWQYEIIEFYYGMNITGKKLMKFLFLLMVKLILSIVLLGILQLNSNILYPFHWKK